MYPKWHLGDEVVINFSGLLIGRWATNIIALTGEASDFHDLADNGRWSGDGDRDISDEKVNIKYEQ